MSKGWLNINLDGKELAKQFDTLADGLEGAVNSAISDVAYSAYAQILAEANFSLSPKEKEIYIDGLEIDQIGPSSWSIILSSPGAQRIEDGTPAYDLKEAFLNSSAKVKKGSRAGQNWVQTSQKGTKYAHVPITRKSGTSGGGSSLIDDIRKQTVQNRKGQKQRIDTVLRDASGGPLSGKVGSFKSSSPLVSEISKYQSVGAGGEVSEVFVGFRTVSENSSGWQHPGKEGRKFIEEAEKWIERELENLVADLL